MKYFNRKQHWNTIYQTKQLDEVSWYQSTPETSLSFVEGLNLPKTAKIIDIDGGDSFLVDYLLELGYKNIAVLDISEEAIKRAKKRLGKQAEEVTWLATDAAHFSPTEQYDVWHDRAAFHFLTKENDIGNYIDAANQGLSPTGAMVIGTFSENGPTKCSGIEIKQYSESSMVERFKDYFEKIKCVSVNHETPFDTVQNFVFYSFKRK